MRKAELKIELAKLAQYREENPTARLQLLINQSVLKSICTSEKSIAEGKLHLRKISQAKKTAQKWMCEKKSRKQHIRNLN